MPQLLGVANAVNVVDASVVSADRDDRGDAVIDVDNHAGFSADVGDVEGCFGAVKREDERDCDGVRAEQGVEWRAGNHATRVELADAVGVEHCDQRVERTRRARVREPQSQRALFGPGRRHVRASFMVFHASSRATRELATRGRRSADDDCDLVERESEDVVQNEDHALRG